MAWTYTLVYDATAIGQRNIVRLKVGDVDTDRQLVPDEAIDYLLSEAGNVIPAAVIRTARAILGRFATRPDRQKVRLVDTAWSDLRERLLAVIAEAQAELATGARPYVGGISIVDIDAYDADTDIPVPRFHENLARHRQPDELAPDIEEARRA